jgi:hypothetical protein
MDWTITKNNINSEYMMSLYDYLGKAAGKELGKEVHRVAHNTKTPMAIKEVSNPKYTGKILMYPKYFLDEYFGVDNKKNDNDNNLPF